MKEFRSLPPLRKLLYVLILVLTFVVSPVVGVRFLSAQDPSHWGGETEVTHNHSHSHEAGSTDSLSLNNLPDNPLYSVPCIAGFAGPFPCDNVDLLAYLPDNALAGSTGSDIWGWTDPAMGKEYAVVGQSNAVAFVDISTPTLPRYLGYLPAPVPNVLWRDVKVYNNHAYIVGDGDLIDPHGLQIFDLTQLRNAGPVPIVFEQSARYMGLGNAHNLAINEETGTAFIVGSDTCAGGPHMLDLSDPLNPIFSGCVDQDGYTHDLQCVIYRGPDSEHAGREICLAANEDTLTILDVTDRGNPAILSRTPYEGFGYTHQGWFTEDQAYFLLSDELDEVNSYLNQAPHNTHTYLWDVHDLDAPVHFSTYVGPTTAIDHNLYIRGDHVFESNYAAGLRILDASSIGAGILSEVGYFDTHPSDNAPAFAGTWSNYAFFESGVVIVNNIEDGLFVLRPRLPAAAAESSKATGGGWLAANDGGKLNFGFQAESGVSGPEGMLEFRDKGAGVNIEMQVTFLGQVSEPCGSVPANNNSMELRGSGTFNGENATFRVCVQDNGNPGRGSDLFYLDCTNACEYETGSRAADAAIDAGNIQVRHGSASSTGQPQPTTVILHPVLLTEGVAGALQTLEVAVYDQNQAPVANAAVTLTRTASDGTSATFGALTNLSGQATFSLLNLNQLVEYSVAAGGVESNVVEVQPVLQ